MSGVGSLLALQYNAKLLGDLAGAEDDFGWHLVAISTGIIRQLEVLPVYNEFIKQVSRLLHLRLDRHALVSGLESFVSKAVYS